jgi:hypothetical protein
MNGETIVSVRIPNDILLGIDTMAFERRKNRARGRAATRSHVIVELLRCAVLKPVASLDAKS